MSPADRDATPRVTSPGCGEVVGDSPDRRVEILADDDALHATWSRFGPGREGADLHVHHDHTDLFYVLDGELTLRLGLQDEPVTVPVGTLALIPPLVVHGFRNASDADVRYLNLHAPGRGFAGYMRALRDGRPAAYDQHPPPPGGGRPATDAVFADDGPEAAEPGMLADSEQITVASVQLEPGAAPPEHAARRATWFYVLGGELTLTAGDSELRATRGAWVDVPAAVAHRLSASEPAHVLAIHAGPAPPG